MKKNYDTLLLDADDTLLDFRKTEKAALENTFDEYGLTLTEEIRDIYKTINHELWSAFERGETTKETITPPGSSVSSTPWGTVWTGALSTSITSGRWDAAIT